MSLYASISALELHIDSYRLEGRILPLTGFERHTTIVCLSGLGEEGRGEDVTYLAGDQRAFQRSGAELPLRGRHTLDGFSRTLDALRLFDRGPDQEASRNYRRWAFESAALDLALRQQGLSLHEALGLAPQPLRFVFSTRLSAPPSIDPLPGFLEHCPSLGFKLDAGRSWSAEAIQRLAATRAVEVIDLKGAYHGTPVDLDADPQLYRRVVEGFPDAWIEDPALTQETEEVLRPHRARITWDAPIHSVADVESLPFPPRMLNIKPSRFGRLRELLKTYEYCRREKIECYGGGQFELGPGRGQIQYLASLFHPGAPNDVAPTSYHDAIPRAGLPAPPLDPRPDEKGFRWLD